MGLIMGYFIYNSYFIHGYSSGRLGPMVTCTLKLGISILNGGNVQVQQV